jgi:hypothetical protein
MRGLYDTKSVTAVYTNPVKFYILVIKIQKYINNLPYRKILTKHKENISRYAVLIALLNCKLLLKSEHSSIIDLASSLSRFLSVLLTSQCC